MKTAYSLQEIRAFLKNIYDVSSLIQLAEGHSSQVVGFKTNQGQRLVIRIRQNEKDLLADKYAYEHFSAYVPIPEITNIGVYDEEAYYCISEYVEGVTVLALDPNSFTDILPKILDTFSNTFHVNISNSQGYGDIDPSTGNGAHQTYKKFLSNELEVLGVAALHEHANKIGLDNKTVDALINQFNNNVQYVSEVRRLTHGDPGGDNMIVRDGSIQAVIDWEQMAYGDWMRDFSRLEYYSNNNYGEASKFAVQYNLEADNLTKRKAVYWAITALREIEFAATQKNEQVTQRLIKSISNKILS